MNKRNITIISMVFILNLFFINYVFANESGLNERLWNLLFSDNVQERIKAVKELEVKSDLLIEPLISALEDPDWHVRDMVVEILGDTKNPKVVEPLIKRLNDSVLSVRCKAAVALGKIGDEQAVEPLIETLNDDYGVVRYASVQALSKIESDKAVEALINFLKQEKNRDLDIYLETINKLGEIGKPIIVEPFREMLNEETDFKIRQVILKALCKTNDSRTLDLLINTVESDKWNEDIKQLAIEALGEIGDVKAVGVLLKNIYEYSLYDESKEALIKIGKPAVEPLLDLLNQQENIYDIGKIAEILGEIGDKRAVEPLVNILKKEGYDREIVKALGKIGDAKVTEPLLDLLDHTEGEYKRGEIIEALGKIGGEKAIRRLCELIVDSDVYREVKDALIQIGSPAVDLLLMGPLRGTDLYMRRAAEVLGEIGSERAIDPLEKALKENKDGDVCEVIIKALVKINKQKAVDSLMYMLAERNDLDRDVLEDAIKVLGEVSDPKATLILVKSLKYPYLENESRKALDKIMSKHSIDPHRLINLLDEGDPAISEWIIMALDRIGKVDRGIIERLENMLKKKWDSYVLRALGKAGDEKTVKLLLEFLQDKEYKNKQNEIVNALGMIGNKQAVEPLLHLLKVVEYSTDRRSVIEALGRIGDKKAVSPLINILMNKGEYDYVREDVVIALGKIGEPEVVDKLINIAQDTEEDYGVRGASINALGMIGDIQTVEPLVKLLSHENICLEVIETLGEFEDPEAINALVDLYLENRKDENWKARDKRQKIIESLKDMIDSQAIGLLKRGVDYRKMSNPEFLISKLDSRSEYVSDVANKKLKDMGAPLIEILVDAKLSTDNKDELLRALEQVKDSSSVYILDSLLKVMGNINEEVREKTREVLSNIQPNIEDSILAKIVKNVLILTDVTQDSQTRIDAALTLGKIGDPVAVDSMARTLADDNLDVVFADIEGLINIGKPAIESLAKYLDDSEIGKDVEYVLGKIEEGEEADNNTKETAADYNLPSKGDTTTNVSVGVEFSSPVGNSRRGLVF